MEKFLDLSSWSVAIGSMLIMAFAFVGCDDSSSASAGQNDEPAVESSSSSSGKVTEPAEVTSSSSEKAKQSNSSSSVGPVSSSNLQSDKKSSSSGVKDTSSSSLKSESSSSVGDSQSSSSSSTNVRSSSSETESSSSSVSELSSSSLNGFDWSLPKEAYLNPNINYGTMTDERDGKVYRTVKIGDQIWMAENLDFDPGQGGSGEDKYDWSWCFDNDPKKCDVAGRLYTWAAAIDSVKLANDANAPQVCGYGRKCNLPAKVQGVCPPDWHLPTQAEWDTLFLSVGGQYQFTAGKALKSQSGWFVINLSNYFFNGNGTDEFGFCALPVGVLESDGFQGDSHFAEFWSSTEADYTDDWAYNACVKNYEDEAYIDFPTRKDVGTSVRCVKD
ncbi:MAG: fibrobacter succinogenes major paralogous domain-containing protein [Fibrobacter sp.]|nr:fibrobacter succinogenes major paralogous domain-containing protein [Fibrobacter sp.]